MRASRGYFDGKKITAEISPKEIFEHVMTEGIMLIKGVFPKDEMSRLKSLVFDWGKSSNTSSQTEFYSNKNNNHFCVEQGVSRVQKTLHHYHSYNFNTPEDGLPGELGPYLLRYCYALRDFYNEVTSSTAEIHSVDGKALHAQVIKYPTGGGHFARHVHPLEPQKIGFITALSQRGEDFNKGGAGFEVDGQTIEIEDQHDAGDIALFRYDLPHWVSPIDIEETMEPASPSGRWSLIIPHY